MVMTLMPKPPPHNSENMHTQIKQTLKPNIPVFNLSGDHEPSMKFIAGRCECKVCRSTDLTYYSYLEDAKCTACRQWQNEDPISE